MKKLGIIIALLIVVGTIHSCKEDEQIEKEFGTPLAIETPENFPDLEINSDNPITEEGVQLGRKLYYDAQLNSVEDKSCASCHDQNTGFSTFSSNALAHINLGWNSSFLWNGAVEGSLEDIMLFEVEDFFRADVDRFNSNETYRKEFKEAFGIDEITTTYLAYALAQFERTKISANSKYDQFMRGEVALTPSERRGWIFFNTEKGDCFHCHGTELFTSNLHHNNGLDSLPEPGRMAVTNNPLDKGKFKSPTLRNIAVTAPYMHDGRFETLEEVVRFYSEGIQHSPTIDPLMKQVEGGGIGLTEQEILDLVAFLETLTDTSFLNNPDFTDPF